MFFSVYLFFVLFTIPLVRLSAYSNCILLYWFLGFAQYNAVSFFYIPFITAKPRISY